MQKGMCKFGFEIASERLKADQEDAAVKRHNLKRNHIHPCIDLKMKHKKIFLLSCQKII